MSSFVHFTESFHQFYSLMDQVETQMSKISCSKSLSLSTLESCNVAAASQNTPKRSSSADKKPSKTEVSKNVVVAKIQKVVKAAKELDNEVKKTSQQQQQRNTPVINKKPKSIYFKSTVPPIWDKQKHGKFIENVMNDLNVPLEIDEENCCNDEVIEFKETTKSILKNNSNAKRNIGTYVKFISEPPTQDKRQQQQRKQQHHVVEKIQYVEKPIGKKTHSIKSNVSDTESHSHLHPPPPPPSSKSLTAAAAASKKPSKLMFSPLTVTSTNCAIDEFEKTIDYNCIMKSNLATTPSPKNIKQIMTKCILPALNVKGSCKIQRIYQLEILPTRGLEQNELSINKNAQFFEFSHSSPVPPPHPSSTSSSFTPTIYQKNIRHVLPETKDASSQVTDPPELQKEQHQQQQKLEGKVRFAVESSTMTRKKKKTFERPSLNKFKRASAAAACANKNSIDKDELKIKLDSSSSMPSSSTSSLLSSSDDEITEAVYNRMNSMINRDRKKSSCKAHTHTHTCVLN